MAAVLHLGTAHLARVVVLKRQDSGHTKARHYVAYGLKVGQKSILGGFERSVIGPKRANRVVPRAVPNPYMHMLGRGQWVRQGSMRSDARVSGEGSGRGKDERTPLRGSGRGKDEPWAAGVASSGTTKEGALCISAGWCTLASKRKRRACTVKRGDN